MFGIVSPHFVDENVDGDQHSGWMSRLPGSPDPRPTRLVHRRLDQVRPSNTITVRLHRTRPSSLRCPNAMTEVPGRPSRRIAIARPPRDSWCLDQPDPSRKPRAASAFDSAASAPVGVVSGNRSDRHNFHQCIGTDQIVGVARVQTCGVRVRCRGDKQVQGPSAWLATGLDHRRGQLTVAGRDRIIHRQRIKLTLQHRQSPQPLGTNTRGLCQQDTEMQFGQRDRADRELPRKWRHIAGEHGASIENRPHAASQGSRTA